MMEIWRIVEMLPDPWMVGVTETETVMMIAV